MCPKKCIIALCPIMHVPEEMHHCIVPDNACARRNASLHMLDITLCSILHVPEEMHHCIVLDIACARRNASFHVLDIACARRNASSHCARDCIVPEVFISSRLHRSKSLHAPESNQVTRVSTDAKNR